MYLCSSSVCVGEGLHLLRNVVCSSLKRDRGDLLVLFTTFIVWRPLSLIRPRLRMGFGDFFDVTSKHAESFRSRLIWKISVDYSTGTSLAFFQGPQSRSPPLLQANLPSPQVGVIRGFLTQDFPPNGPLRRSLPGLLIYED